MIRSVEVVSCPKYTAEDAKNMSDDEFLAAYKEGISYVFVFKKQCHHRMYCLSLSLKFRFFSSLNKNRRPVF